MMRLSLPAKSDPLDGLSSSLDTLPPRLRKKFDCLRSINSDTAAFWSMPLLPSLVTFYQWLYDSQAYVLTEDEAMKKTVGQLFAELACVEGRACCLPVCVCFSGFRYCDLIPFARLSSPCGSLFAAKTVGA